MDGHYRLPGKVSSCSSEELPGSSAQCLEQQGRWDFTGLLRRWRNTALVTKRKEVGIRTYPRPEQGTVGAPEHGAKAAAFDHSLQCSKLTHNNTELVITFLSTSSQHHQHLTSTNTSTMLQPPQCLNNSSAPKTQQCFSLLNPSSVLHLHQYLNNASVPSVPHQHLTLNNTSALL